MHEDLPGLKRELRQETCPQRVIDAAKRQIAAEPTPPGRFRYGLPAALACLVLLCGFLIRRQMAIGNPHGQDGLAERQAPAPTQVARETETALNVFGTVLLDAGVRSGTVISARALPPLQHGFDTARNLITQHTEL